MQEVTWCGLNTGSVHISGVQIREFTTIFPGRLCIEVYFSVICIDTNWCDLFRDKHKSDYAGTLHSSAQFVCVRVFDTSHLGRSWLYHVVSVPLIS